MPDRADDGRALLIYDGDCAFCRLWVEAWRARTGNRVIYAPAREIAEKFPDIPRARYRRAIQLIDADGRRHEGAQAVFRALAHAPGRGWLLKLYEAPLVAPISEGVYRFVSGHRALALRITVLLWGPKIEAPRYGLTAGIFLRALAVVYLVAFLSWLPQLPGLVGGEGLVPAPPWLQVDALQVLTLLGAVAALLAFAGVLVAPMFLAAWAAYLSIVTVTGDFAAFQWDHLLLEAGFLAVFLLPFRRAAAWAGQGTASPAIIWLVRFLLFRLMFMSGAAKLLSGDPSWRGLTALRHHFETQPLPTPLAWYAHRLPEALLKLAAFGTMAVEIAVPFLFLMPRRARQAGAAITAASQVLLMATGNFAFLNWLTLALCIPLFDDAFFERLFRRRRKSPPAVHGQKRPTGRFRQQVIAVVAVLVITLGLTYLAAAFIRLPRSAIAFASIFAPFRIVNGYGLFAVMTTSRPEIVIEGSADGREWKAYEFRQKPGDVKRAPGWVAPFHPRLDWQMWFAALADPGQEPWFAVLMVRLLQGSEPVLALFEEDPFPGAPPAYVRATLYRYRFTTPEEKALDGAWWRREMKVEYFPQMSLRSLTGGQP